MMKYKILIILLAAAIAATVAFIFNNSLAVSEESSAQSDNVVDTIQPIVDPDGEISRETFSHWVRKAAHALEFGLLGMELTALTAVIMRNKKREIYKFICTPLFFILLTGVTDEYIQSFSDRSSCVKDVFIDFSGGVVGLLIVWGILSLLWYFGKKRAKKAKITE